VGLGSAENFSQQNTHRLGKKAFSSLVIISGANFTQQLNVITLVAAVNTAHARTFKEQQNLPA
jgi:hypothetical protein